LKQNGLRAFQRNDFTAAIKDWSRLNPKTEPAVGSALAEAHFRRALNTADASQRVSDLTRATELAPQEGRFWYHLGLTQHRAGRLADACAAYSRAAETGFARRPLTFARGLAEIERNPRLDPATFNAITGGDTAALLPILAFLRGDPQAVLAPAAANWFDHLKGQMRGDAMTALWRGLALVTAGQPAEAAATLSARPGSLLPGEAEMVRVFYRGLTLAAAGDRSAALVEWAALPERASTARLQAAVAENYRGQVRDALLAGRWADVLKATDAVFKLAGPSTAPPELLAAALIARGRLARAAAERAAWAEAISHWQQMADLLELLPSLGPRGPVLHNLAIAYEATEQWGSAATMWVHVMSTLPRRQTKKAKPPAAAAASRSAEAAASRSAEAAASRSAEAAASRSAEAAATPPVAGAPAGRLAGLSVTEKRAWLRRRALESYRKAGQMAEAIAQCRAAVKAAPDDLDLRLELANALLANDQEIAGRNELRRILERDPSHQEACIKLAELHQARGEVWEAERLLQAAVAADPDNASVRRGLVELLRQRGHGQFNAGYHAGARDTYAAALKIAPDDVDLLASIGFAEWLLNDQVAARGHFETALAKATPDAYLQVLTRWASIGLPDEFRALLARAETAGIASPHLFVDAAGMCFNMANRAAPDPFFAMPRKSARVADPWEELGKTLLAKIEASAADPAEVYRHLVAELGPLRPALALSYAEKLVALTPDDPAALLALAIVQGLNNQRRQAKETLRRAGQLARKLGNPQLGAEIEDIRRSLDNPMFGMMPGMLPMFGNAGFEDLF
jgi:tetratricopeptide (TPR) repeat protein